MSAAVISHFDSRHIFDKEFIDLATTVNSLVDDCVVVTTSPPRSTRSSLPNNIHLITRPNVGYDFYSYRVGLTFLNNHGFSGPVLFLNSSFYVLDMPTFTRALHSLLRLTSRHNAAAFTTSHQFSFHMQTYCFALSEACLRSHQLTQFFATIEPRNTKLETIFAYEIGLTKRLRTSSASIGSVYRPGPLSRIKAMAVQLLRTRRVEQTLISQIGKALRRVQEVNWCHFAAADVAKQLGIVKCELLRSNPHNVSLRFISPYNRAAHFLKEANNTSQQYRRTRDGLSCFMPTRPLGSDFESVLLPWRGKQVVTADVAVVIHAYYLHLLPDLLSYLPNILEPYDLFITTPHQADVPELVRQCSLVAQATTRICVFDNRGRDIRPFLGLLRSRLLDNYSAVLKIHTKHSTYSDQGTYWRNDLLRSLAGNSLVVRAALGALRGDSVGMIGPGHYYLSHQKYWGANRARLAQVMSTLYPTAYHDPVALGFFAGSMFWYSPTTMKPLIDCPEHVLDFERERGQQDGTLAHAIERIFCLLARNQGLSVTATSSPLKQINDNECVYNTVPVLSA
jgi:lipopolysaccharide biosynthesis protein